MIKILDNLYLFEGKTNVLLYINKKECILIDSGKSIKLKELIKNFIEENNLKLTGIINTHCHSDHISNNDLDNCNIYSSKTEKTIIENYNFQLDILYGGKHPKFMEDTFLSSNSFKTCDLPKIDNIEYINLLGHSYNMIGIYINKKVLYIGDALFSENELKGIPYVYDIGNFLNSIEKIKQFKDNVIISSHIGIIYDLDKLINFNVNFVHEIKNMILEICKEEKTFDNIVETICKHRNINLNEINYWIITSTIRSFITFLIDNNLLKMIFKNYNLYYKINK